MLSLPNNTTQKAQLRIESRGSCLKASSFTFKHYRVDVSKIDLYIVRFSKIYIPLQLCLLLGTTENGVMGLIHVVGLFYMTVGLTCINKEMWFRLEADLDLCFSCTATLLQARCI